MKLEKLKDYEEWMRSERKEIFNKLVDEYIHEYKWGLDDDNLCMVMKDDTHYILPRKEYSNLDNILKSNGLNKDDVKNICEFKRV